MTVGELLEYIYLHNVDRNAEVLVQRVEYIHFEGFNISGMRGLLPDGTYGVYPEGSKSTGWPTVQKEGDCGMTEYISIHCPVRWDNDNRLYLDLHY
ncbi:hypothetical protein SAMN06269173_11184 [Hymenobacter mucosus]|uniref:Uncharacterized protein n=1 Tax=Hymenobacter mucosus TaxID=1411120 RepID=A0A239AB15_9BACT|nr:hypothetical protein SAMN06269173_11184 [Hymenobacter mucosus]